MSEEQPTVSVVMAAYNGAAFIRQTIETVLTQTMPDFEIVVVDDCSKDATVAVLEAIDDPRLRVVRAPVNSGPAIARTMAMDHARGRFIAGLDQDDLCRPDRFARQLAYLDAHPEVVLVASTIEMFGAGRVRADPYPDLTDPAIINWTLTLLNPLAWSTVMMRGEVARALVPFERDERRFAEDFDLYHRVLPYGHIGRITELPLVRYRLHPGGASQAYEEGMIASAARVLADRYAGLFADIFAGGDLAAAMLMSRHAGAGYPPPDGTTLAACGQVLVRLLDAFGALAPDYAPGSANELWWRMARSGLRAGCYSATEMVRACPAFVVARDALGAVISADMVHGVARRLARLPIPFF